MSVYILDNSPRICAENHASADLSLAVQHSAHILCNAHYRFGNSPSIPYKPSKIRTEMSEWTAHSRSNWRYMVRLGLYLSYEYGMRYEKPHKSTEALQWLRNNQPQNQIERGFTPFPYYEKALEFPVKNPIDSWRVGYVVQNLDVDAEAYSGRAMPEWWGLVKRRLEEYKEREVADETK